MVEGVHVCCAGGKCHLYPSKDFENQKCEWHKVSVLRTEPRKERPIMSFPPLAGFYFSISLSHCGILRATYSHISVFSIRLLRSALEWSYVDSSPSPYFET